MEQEICMINTKESKYDEWFFGSKKRQGMRSIQNPDQMHGIVRYTNLECVSEGTWLNGKLHGFHRTITPCFVYVIMYEGRIGNVKCGQKIAELVFDRNFEQILYQKDSKGFFTDLKPTDF